MSLSNELLVAEAERLIARTEREVRRHRSGGEHARQAERGLKRLQLYRAVLKGTNSAHALMPEYVTARGLASTSTMRD